MISQAGDLARRLARYAEAVCRHYLSNGRRRGRYWVIGDAMNTPGRSLYVRLTGPDSGPGAAGKWTDAASPSEHGDLLDLIRLNRNLNGLGEAMNEARCFLALPQPATPAPVSQAPSTTHRSPDAARRLFAASCPIPGTPAEAYLRARGITTRLDWPALRYHPSVYYRASEDAPHESWPALLAAVTNLNGIITGIQRTWLDPRRSTKAPLADPRRALGHLLGNGVRFGAATKPALAQAGVLAAGEGIETMLALKSVLPSLPVVAGLSATHLAALDLSPRFRPGAGLYGRQLSSRLLSRFLVDRRGWSRSGIGRSEGSSPSGLQPSTLVFGRPSDGAWTMMQRCASGATLRATGPFSGTA